MKTSLRAEWATLYKWRFTLLYSTLLYSSLFYSTLLYSALLYSTLLYSTLLYSTLLYSTLLYSTLLCSALLCSALLYSTLLYSVFLANDPLILCLPALLSKIVNYLLYLPWILPITAKYHICNTNSSEREERLYYFWPRF